MVEQAIGRAPAFTLEAIGHGRRITLDSIGAPAVLLFVGRETQSQVDAVVQPVRDRHPTAAEATICNVADVRGIPRLVRKAAEMMLKSSYNHRVEALDPGKTPEEYVLILPDWDGDVFKALGVEDVSKQIAVAVIGRDGNLCGTYQGNEPGKAALELLERAG